MSFGRALSICFLLSCADDPANVAATGPSSVKQAVGPDGGTIVVQGATVTIPKGALTTSLDITISASESGPPNGFVALSKVFVCEPSGTDFAEPVTMKMPFDDDGKPSSIFWSTGADPTFKDVGGEVAGGAMTATVRHFSSGFVGRKK
jgi:hypothetical protein